jgi:hypothetical protein
MISPDFIDHRLPHTASLMKSTLNLIRSKIRRSQQRTDTSQPEPRAHLESSLHVVLLPERDI